MLCSNMLLRMLLPVMLLSCAAGASMVIALQGSAARAQDSAGVQQAAPVLTIIVTRHGVRSPGAESSRNEAEVLDKDEAADEAVDEVESAAAGNNSPADQYKWANWNIVDPPGKINPRDLTKHGYVLMTVMGNYYRHELSPDKDNPQFDCGQLFVYADVDQRTLGTAHALVEGLCGSPDKATIFHEQPDPNPNPKIRYKRKDPLFNATDWAFDNNRIVPRLSTCAIRLSVGAEPNTCASGGDKDKPTQTYKAELSQFQGLLNKRCKQQPCERLDELAPQFHDAKPKPPVKAPVNPAEKNVPLASLSGPVDTGRTWLRPAAYAVKA
jgi:Histidine phosphatase superfamily (branch 2)